MKVKIIKKLFLGLSMMLIFVLPASSASSKINISENIVIDVEADGEAWYINPDNDLRYYLGRPNDAFELMKNLGVGISSVNLRKIPIWLPDDGEDTDGDGLNNDIEEAIGTNPNVVDTDLDGFSDKNELEKNFNPLGSGNLDIDDELVNKLLGKILLQVEDKGQAWYLSPRTKLRYYLGRPKDAFRVIQKIGLGVKSGNIEEIGIANLTFKKVFDKTKSNRDQTIYGSGFKLTSCDQITEQDVYELCLRIRDKDEEEFEAVLLSNKVHQHVGPNNVYGAKMALYARDLLNGENYQISVLSETTKQPISCLDDGIITAIGATYGRNLIQKAPQAKNILAATFTYKNKAVRLEVKPDKLEVSKKFIADSLKKYGGLTDGYFKDVRSMGLWVWEKYNRNELFDVSYPEIDSCAYNETNVSSYNARLHSIIHQAISNDNILKFVDNDDCVKNGSVEIGDYKIDGYNIKIISEWKSNDKKVEFSH